MLPIGHTMRVFSAQFSPDGKKIVTASPDNTAKIWDAVTGNILADLRGHTGPLQTAQFSPDGKKIVTASFDHTAKIWDAGTGKLLIDL
jgi:WD40 repeat protein